MANVTFTLFMSLDPGFCLCSKKKTSQVRVGCVVPRVIRTLLCCDAGEKEEQEIERKSFHLKIFFLCMASEEKSL